jgi:uncharacterized protein with von Willebrand factor type A (vWA) domain
MRDLLRALPMLDLHDKQTVYYAARSLLCARKEDLPRFDLIFRQFWGRTRQVIIPSDMGSLTEPTAPPPHDQPGKAATGTQPTLPLVDRATLIDSEGAGDRGEEEAGAEDLTHVLLYSAQERLRDIDFSNFTEEELAAARAILATWRWQPGLRRTRRLKAARRGRRFDFSRTVRRAMRTQGVPYTLAMRGPRHKPRPLVLLCDISGSMAPYTRMLLHFLHTLRRGVGHAEVFVFGTRLTRITRQLRYRDVDRALEEVARHVGDWSGGTRLGEALRMFNTHWARRVLSQGAVVVIISDGWDRGDPVLLAAEMAHLQRTAFRLVWLNPLLGVEGYQPITRGMVAALPFVDNFLPANTLGSLRVLADLLTSLHVNIRPDRRQGSSVHVRDAMPPPTAAPRFDVKIEK